ncbi:Protein-arginine deiminase [Purpureocillium takamizusanense]|uniref:Protein-arginine deiminase n=1 Tax=Purpureocillium takamizusanense TaxID=2060973 RepID=A0A9Q8QBF6_9HYPO|nr:Protein-arginine deiminase [Purpureocillium takamizusanense]UNI16973.1 Protein-arginine deiminase [Purpureocillium takamizusanense]
MRLALALPLCLSVFTFALDVTIVGDTNRDGTVDVTGDTDLHGRDTWTDRRGAIFLANIGDTNRRCSSNVTDARSLTLMLDNCNDASGNEQRNPKYLAPLRTLPIQGLSDKAVGSVRVTDEAAAEKVRIFHSRGQEWAYVSPDYVFASVYLRNGLELGIDARDIRRPGKWDGRVTIEIQVRDGNEEAKDKVALRVAPIITHHHGQPVKQIIAIKTSIPYHQVFADDLTYITTAAGINKPPVIATTREGNIWAQDQFEAAYTSMPGPNSSSIVLEVMVVAALERQGSGPIVKQLLSDSVGAVRHHKLVRVDDNWIKQTIEPTGNLETIPPYTHNGRSYPAGRVIFGSKSGFKPLFPSLMEAQETQSPVEVDVTWLRVGHVDEFMQFLPSRSRRGWIVAVTDPIATLTLFKKAQQDGHGNTKALSRPGLDTDPPTCIPNSTIDDVLRFPGFETIQKFSARNIAKAIDVLKRETGITDAEILRVPGLYYDKIWSCDDSGKSKLKARDDIDASTMPAEPQIPDIIKAAGGTTMAQLDTRAEDDVPDEDYWKYEEGVVALYPAAINGVVLNNPTYLAPKQWGPVINGRDILKERVTAAYKLAGFDALYIDDYFTGHVKGGDVHCLTNTIRETSGKWWQGDA